MTKTIKREEDRVSLNDTDERNKHWNPQRSKKKKMSRKQLSTTKINIAENTLIQRFPWAYQTSTELVNIEELPVLWREISCSSVTSE